MKKKFMRGIIAISSVICLTILPAVATMAEPEISIPGTDYRGESIPESFVPTTTSPKATTPELTIEQTTDKAKYGATDNITVTLEVTNASEHGSFAKNVKLFLETPDDYILADGNKAETTLATLEAGETATLKTTFVSKNANPKTGDNNAIFWIAGALIISGGVIVFCIRFKKNRKIFLSIFVGFIVAGSLLASTGMKVSAGEEVSGKIEKTTTVKVNNKDLTLKGTVTYDEWVVMPGKGDLVTLDENKNAQFRVIKTNGTQAEVLAMSGIKKQFNIESKELQVAPNVVIEQYKDSNLDNYLNGNTEGCYYYGLSENIKKAIVPQNINQYVYNWHTDQTKSDIEFDYWTATYDFEKPMTYYIERTPYSTNVGERNVYALDVVDVVEYLGEGNITPENVNIMFLNTDTIVNTTCWLRSARYPQRKVVFYIYTHYGAIDSYEHDKQFVARGAFTIDLSKCTWDYISD